MVFGDEITIIPKQFRPKLSDLVGKRILLAAPAFYEVFSIFYFFEP